MAAFRTPILVAALAIVALAASGKDHVGSTEICGTDGGLLQTNHLVQKIKHAENEGELEAASSDTTEDDTAKKEEDTKNDISKATPCQTLNAEACAFPFKYKGVSYDSCTSADGSANQLWCATQTDAQGVFASWGICAGSCSVLAPEHCITKSYLHYEAEACVFPFRSQGVTYNACTSKGYDRLWCATQADNTGAYSSWADCGSCATGVAPIPIKAEKMAIVDELYTYGTPPAGDLEDLSHSSSCFPGMRSYTENIHKWWPTDVDYASVSTPFQHARTGTLVLHWASDSSYYGCPGKSSWPKGVKHGFVPSMALHDPLMYKDRIQYNTASVLDSAQHAKVNVSMRMALFPYLHGWVRGVWWDTTHLKEAMLGTRKVSGNRWDTPGWTLVAFHVVVGYTGKLGTDTDVIMLAQNEASLECVLGFSGTDSQLEYLTSLNSASTSFCGFSSVHKGFTEEIWSLTASTQYQTDVKPKLGKCSKVTVAGHSLGGAISEVFAACINSGRTDQAAYQQMIWTKGTAEKMNEI